MLVTISVWEKKKGLLTLWHNDIILRYQWNGAAAAAAAVCSEQCIHSLLAALVSTLYRRAMVARQ